MIIRITASVLFALAAAALVAAGPKCDPLPVLRTDRVIDGTASKEGQLLIFVAVGLYSGRKVVRLTTTDAQGHFLLENLPLGRYTLSFQLLGSFQIEVTPPRMSQQASYGFGSFHGCLNWSMSSD